MPTLVHVAVDLCVAAFFVVLWVCDHPNEGAAGPRMAYALARGLMDFLGLDIGWRMFAHKDTAEFVVHDVVRAYYDDGRVVSLPALRLFELTRLQMMLSSSEEMRERHGVALFDYCVRRLAPDPERITRIELLRQRRAVSATKRWGLTVFGTAEPTEVVLMDADYSDAE
jgi:hypothetical protein